MTRLFGVLAWVLSAAAPAFAHQSSVTYSQVRIQDDGQIEYTLLVSSRDLYEALGLEKDRDASDAEIRAGEPRLFEYVLRRLTITADGRDCPVERRGLRIVTQTDRFAELRFRVRCPAPLDRVDILYHLFFELDARHVCMARIAHGDREIQHEFSKGFERFAWEVKLGRAPRSVGAADYVKHGVEHIFTGYDHIAFVLALLILAAARPRRLRQGLGDVAKIVTAFTVAHSITLILAGLEVVQLPSRFVESAIAASIVYVAVENLWLVESRHRWALAFGFGMVHGLGFAAVLRPMLPRTGVVLPLLAFNVGVELGQLCIVSVVYPLLHAVARAGAQRYRRVAIWGGSGVIALLGLFWLIQRALGVTLIR